MQSVNWSEGQAATQAFKSSPVQAHWQTAGVGAGVGTGTGAGVGAGGVGDGEKLPLLTSGSFVRLPS